MSESDTENVPRTPEGPTAEDVVSEMRSCEPYKASDLTEVFDDVSRWTIQRRLESLHDDGRIERKKHADGSVSWWVSSDST